jgi:hypothetical protein
MNRTRWLLSAAYLVLPMAGALSMSGCNDKGETGSQVQGQYDAQKDREQHEVNQKKYMDELRKQGRR